MSPGRSSQWHPCRTPSVRGKELKSVSLPKTEVWALALQPPAPRRACRVKQVSPGTQASRMETYVLEISCRNLAPKTVGAGKSAVGESRLGTGRSWWCSLEVEFLLQQISFALKASKDQREGPPHYGCQ